jgi:phosphomannomutase
VKQLKISSSWIRGVVGSGVTPELMTDFACAFGTFVDGREVVLARDTRRSSPMFAAAALSGLLSTACPVANAGICPTPVAQWLVRRRRAGGAVVVSGSHNDSRWNALKFINEDGALLNPVQGEEVLDLYHAREFTKASWQAVGRETPIAGYGEAYLADTVGKLDLAAIRKAAFRVVIDLGNGACGSVINEFCAMLGCRPVLINEETTGDFARDPAPTPANMRQLASLLRHVSADVGFAVNTDVDRVGVVTEKGIALSEEYTLPLVADHVLRGTRAAVATNLSTSQMIERVVASHQGRLIRTKIGEGNVIASAINEGALLAGEGSGGVAYLPIVHGFDGLLVMALILEAMARSGRRLSELAGALPSFVMKKGVIPCSPDRVYGALEEIRKLYRTESVDLADGVRVTWPGQWLHVRASTTEPLLRVIAEGEDAIAVERLFADTVARVTTVVHGKS